MFSARPVHVLGFVADAGGDLCPDLRRPTPAGELFDLLDAAADVGVVLAWPSWRRSCRASRRSAPRPTDPQRALDGVPLDVRPGGRRWRSIAGVRWRSSTDPRLRTPRATDASPDTDESRQSGWPSPVTERSTACRAAVGPVERRGACPPASVRVGRRAAHGVAGRTDRRQHAGVAGLSPCTLTAVPSAKRTRFVRCSGTALDASHRHPPADQRPQVHARGAAACRRACSASMPAKRSARSARSAGWIERLDRAAAAPGGRRRARSPHTVDARRARGSGRRHRPSAQSRRGGRRRSRQHPGSSSASVTSRGRGRTSALRRSGMATACDALERRERSARVRLQPHVDHRRLDRLDEARRAGTARIR